MVIGENEPLCNKINTVRGIDQEENSDHWLVLAVLAVKLSRECTAQRSDWVVRLFDYS